MQWAMFLLCAISHAMPVQEYQGKGAVQQMSAALLDANHNKTHQ